jgi:hypothetical protein
MEKESYECEFELKEVLSLRLNSQYRSTAMQYAENCLHIEVSKVTKIKSWAPTHCSEDRDCFA